MTSVMVTPTHTSELVAGEIAYSSFRGIVIAMIVITLGFIIGAATPSLWVVPTILFFVLGALTMGAMSTSLAAAVKQHEMCDLITPIVNMPSLLFCGVFVPVVNYPEWVQSIISIYPLYHMVELVRPALHGTLTLSEALPHLTYLVLLLAFFSWLAHYYMKKRLFD